ncbi:MAG: hypothetical protein KGZ90_05085 [Algoriphagus sp.]|nr:hypothetical protein [Algoriphagus sp.]
MSITIQKNKLSAFISIGTKDDLQVYSDAIESAIDFYLCQEDFKPILREQAEVIYFLKWLKKSLAFNQDDQKHPLGKVSIEIPKNDPNLLQCFQESLEKAMQELLVHGSEGGLEPHLSDSCFFLLSLRKALTPNLANIFKELNYTYLN